MKHIIISLVFVLDVVFSQPKWIDKTPIGFQNDYFVGKGRSRVSKTDAIQSAFQDAISSVVKNGNIKIQVNESYSDNKTEKFGNGKSISLDQISKIAREINTQGESQSVSGLKEVERYVEESGDYFEAYVLVKKTKEHPLQLPSEFSRGIAPVWRSVLVPGWGQLYKEQSFKGYSFMALTLGSVASGFIFNEMSNNAADNANSARTQARRDFYNNNKKTYNTVSLISFITAGIFYAWNVGDAIMSKDETFYVDFRSDRNSNNLCFNVRF